MSANFLKAFCKNLDSVNGTMKLHAVFSLKPNWIWIWTLPVFALIVLIVIFEKIRVAKAVMNVN